MRRFRGGPALLARALRSVEATRSARGHDTRTASSSQRGMTPALPTLPGSAMNADPSDRPSGPSFRTTLARVMLVQIVTLVLLWLLQSRYSG
jgi:hypothetical protein